MRFKSLVIIGGCFAMAVFQLLVHWFMSTSYLFSNAVLQWYIYRSPQSGKGVSGLLDTTLPMAVLGFLIGYVGWQWSLRKLALFVVLTGIGIVALQPAYTLFLNENLLWWFPKTTGDLIFFIVREGTWAILGVGVFAYGGRCFGAYYGDKTAAH
jgi:hypothetical protein